MADQGATPSELLFESCRRDNTTLLQSLLTSLSSSQIAHLINTARDGIGNFSLHVAAAHGSYDVLDLLLDQHDVEVDPVDRMDGDTPLHKAVRWVNALGAGQKAEGVALVEMLVDAGADVRVRNKGKLKAVELLDPRDKETRLVLQKAEYAAMLGPEAEGDEGADGGEGSASDEG